jgi:hypothetical protein
LHIQFSSHFFIDSIMVWVQTTFSFVLSTHAIILSLFSENVIL